MTYPPLSLLFSAQHKPPLPLNPALYSLNMPHEMPHDSMTYRCSELFVPICACLSVCQTPELYKRGESQFVCARCRQGRAIATYHSGVTEKNILTLAQRLRKKTVCSTETTITHGFKSLFICEAYLLI